MTERDESMFQIASSYAKSAKCLNGASLEDPSLLIPSQVNAALALELYFKSLYYVEHKEEFKIKDKHSHDFYKLFMALNESTRKELKLEFKEIMKNRDMKDVKLLENETKKKITRSFEANLESWRDIFVKARYIYDHLGKVGKMMFFPEIETALVNVITKRNRDAQPNKRS